LLGERLDGDLYGGVTNLQVPIDRRKYRGEGRTPH
jgi:hypothetical protein